MRFGKLSFPNLHSEGFQPKIWVWRQMGTKVTWYLSQTLKNHGSHSCPLCSLISDPQKKHMVTSTESWHFFEYYETEITWLSWRWWDVLHKALFFFAWFQLTLGAHYPLSKSILWSGSFVGWSRVCRPGTVHGSQQQYLVNLEPCAMKFREEINHV